MGADGDALVTMSNVRLKDAPLVAQLFSLASLQGLADVLSGDGVMFTEVHAPVKFVDGRIDLPGMRATGPAMGLTARGWIAPESRRAVAGWRARAFVHRRQRRARRAADHRRPVRLASGRGHVRADLFGARHVRPRQHLDQPGRGPHPRRAPPHLREPGRAAARATATARRTEPQKQTARLGAGPLHHRSAEADQPLSQLLHVRQRAFELAFQAGHVLVDRGLVGLVATWSCISV